MTALNRLLASLHLDDWRQNDTWPGVIIDGKAHYPASPPITLASPIDGAAHGIVLPACQLDVDVAVAGAHAAFLQWRQIPAPQRGELVRRIGNAVRRHKDSLAQLVTLETGKIASEAAGEVQEWIDLCDFAVGLSRQLHGLTIASERPNHRLMEQWHPLGPVGVITAFNFPLAVWAWNAMLALVCGDAVVWKPSEKTPLCALAATRIVLDVIADSPGTPTGLVQLVQGKADVGHLLATNPQLPLISATGSVRMGRAVAQTVAGRLGRSLLELGGNNALIVAPSADLDLALRAIVFAAAGTCGQRCTSLRRLIVHESVADTLLPRLVAAYQSLKIGDPREADVLIGPLIDGAAAERMQAALQQAIADGGTVVVGGEAVESGVPNEGYYVQPAIVDMPAQTAVMQEETFAPILYVLLYREWDEALALQNSVAQGLSSAVFTRDLREAEAFIGPAGSDCGLANVNAGTSGAEIGGAFGGEKDTGGGRESGSDAWKAYMRRATNTINYGSTLPLAQGVKFL
ncbi:L-piperidine-6-carboxylate dehydrogenase [Andreprevotia chitinilytica]|uniref:L-piperidine-6-carboxylate dehydrogenase n=1 Tax=Andreprevotia chitinilytica TaxID=396808 RepID=UPI00068D2CDF|nr:aldehyde dehydrogenase family protein [Andreprevotia chitinilytica]